MKLNLLQTEPVTIVEVCGRIDTTTSTYFQEEMLKVLNSNRCDIELKCSQLNYVSSSGVRALLVSEEVAKSLGKTITLCNLQPQIKKLVTVSQFETYFKFKD